VWWSAKIEYVPYICRMTSSTIGLIIEIAEAFRQDNATWLRLLGLALAAIMAMNVIFHVREMMG
jgi:hypothetical protein